MKMRRLLAVTAAFMLMQSVAVCAATDTGAAAGSAQTVSSVSELAGSYGDNGSYVNNTIGIGVTFDQNWTIADQATLAKLNGIIVSQCSDEDLAKQISNSGTATILYALRAADGSTVNMNIQDMNVIYGMMLDEDTICDASISMIPDMLKAYGMQAVEQEKIRMNFAGGEHPGIRLRASANGREVCEVAALVKRDHYVSTVTASATSYDKCTEILNMFYAVQ